MYETLSAHLRDVVNVLLTTPINMGEKFYFVYLLTFIGLAYLSYRLYYRREQRGFFRFLFPARIYWHPSARVDYGIYLINLLLSPLFLVGAGLQAYASAGIASR